MKKALKIAAAGFILAALAGIVAPFFIPWDKIKTEIELKTSARLQRKITIDKVTFNIFRGVELNNLTIKNSFDPVSGDFIKSEKAVLRYQFLALLKGKIAVSRMELINPVVSIEKVSEGKFNFSDLLELKAADEKNSASAVAVPLALSISDIKITRGLFNYSDNISSKSLSCQLNGINLEIRDIAFNSSRPVLFYANATLMYNNYPVDINAKARVFLRIQEKTLDFKELTLNIGGSVVSSDGNINLASGDVKFTPCLNIKSQKLLDIMRNVVFSSKTAIEPLSINGDIIVKGVLEGNLNKLDFSFKSIFDAADAEIKYSDIFLKSRGKNFTVDLESRISKDKAEILKCETSLMDIKANIRGRIDDFKKPVVKLTLNISRTKLSSVLTLLPSLIKNGIEINGDFSSNAQLSVDPLDLWNMKIKGNLSVYNSSGKIKDANYNISGLNTNISFTEKNIIIDSLSINIGKSSMKGKINITGCSLADFKDLKKDLTPHVSFYIDCPVLFVDEVFPLPFVMASIAKENKKQDSPVSAEGVNQTSQAGQANPTEEKVQQAKETVRLIPIIEGRLTAGKIVYKKIETAALSSSIVFKNNILELNTVSINAYDGTLKGNCKIDFNPEKFSWDISSEIKGFKSELFINAAVDSFFNEDENYKNKLSGDISGNIKLIANGTISEEIKKSIAGKISFKILSGSLKDADVLRKLAEFSKIDRFANAGFNELSGNITLGSGRADVSELKLTANDIRISANGWLEYASDNDNKLDFTIETDISKNIADAIPKSDKFFEFIADNDGFTPVDFKLSNTAQKLHFELLTERMEKNLKNKTKEELKEKLKNLFKGINGN